jgi:hypothetical protein
MRIGEIVTLKDRPGHWIFWGMSPTAIPPLVMAKFVRASGPHDALTIGFASAVPVCCPIFAPGMTVTHQGEPHQVEGDDGATVILVYSGRKVAVPPREYTAETFSHSGRTLASRAALVRSNLSKFITV